ncbi:MAG: fibronectin type III domain-containing protein, partial [Proteobacteria bacterium]|nr:fibronectin type III domain-containing protein [Pseudomonadota bacterium]
GQIVIKSISAHNTFIVINASVPSNYQSPVNSIQYSLDGGASWITPVSAFKTSSITLGGLTRNTVYNIRLRAINLVGAGLASTTVRTKTLKK